MKDKTERPKILVVDDDHDFACDLKAWLTKEGYCVHVAELGKAAIQHFNLYRPYAAVLLDLHMPKVNGYDVLEEIKITDFRTKVAILSGDTTAGRGNIPLADDFVLKPVGRKDICRCVRNLLEMAEPSACAA